MNNKKGSSSVFLMVIFAALVAITFTLIYGVREDSVSSRVDGIINLAGDSLMSEFDYNVQKEYGLFMICGTDDELSDKLESYIDYTIADMEEVNLESTNVSTGKFSVIDKELIEEQILEYMKLMEAEGVLDKLAGSDSNKENHMEEKTLRHGPTIVSLPSQMVPSKKLTALAESIAANAGKVDEVFKKGTEKYLINRYILTHFNCRNSLVNTEHFFRNEGEYILGGELSDRKNEKRVEMALKVMRFPLNLAHIYSDPEKEAATMAMAQAMTPGAAAVVTQATLASTWAYAEADNDVELIFTGHKVPMIKDKYSWAMDLDSAIEGVLGGTAMPEVDKGYDYDKYLQILLFFQNENIKIARILDLIQINTRKDYNKDFVIQEYSTGVTIDVTVNGKRYSYEKQY